VALGKAPCESQRATVVHSFLRKTFCEPPAARARLHVRFSRCLFVFRLGAQRDTISRFQLVVMPKPIWLFRYDSVSQFFRRFSALSQFGRLLSDSHSNHFGWAWGGRCAEGKRTESEEGEVGLGGLRATCMTGDPESFVWSE
jgi:hypothetical protein